MNVSVVIPTYNERENIPLLIPKIFSELKKAGVDGKVIVVDDNSPDDTAAEVKRLSEAYNVVLISRPVKSGLGSAYICGFKEALKSSDIVFEMDADLSHEPECIPSFLDALSSCDVVIGSRYVPGGKTENWGIYRKAVSWGGNYIGRKLMGIRINDITTGYRAYKKDVLRAVDIDSIKSNGYAFQAEILYRVWDKNFSIKEVPIVFRDRKEGVSKLSKREMCTFFLLCSDIFFRRGPFRR